MPPSGFLAGIYARNDIQHSVAKAPANEVVLGALRFERDINFAEQELLNPLGINCLRFFPGRGYRVWGARTASLGLGDGSTSTSAATSSTWSTRSTTARSGPCSRTTGRCCGRTSANRSRSSSTTSSERQPAGRPADAEAFFVRCDRSTMTQNDLDNGRLICLVGVALLKPAEFVIFRIGQKTADARS